MKNKTILLLSIGMMLILIPVISYSQDICFSQDDSKKIVVELERGRLLEKNIQLLEQENNELIKQTNLLKEQNKLILEQYQACNDLLKKNEDIYKLKIQALENDLTDMKKDKRKSMLGSFGVGALTGILLMLFFI